MRPKSSLNKWETYYGWIGYIPVWIFPNETHNAYMKLAREYPNSTALSNLGMTKALTLLTLSPEKRDEFIKEPHNVYGVDEAVSEMSTRKVEEAVREYKGSQKKYPTTKSKKQYTFQPRSKKDRMKHPPTKPESGTAPEPEYDVKTNIAYMQAYVNDLVNYLLEDEHDAYFEEYCHNLAEICESILPCIWPHYGIHMCIEHVTAYLDCYYDNVDDYKDELLELCDKIQEVLSTT